jgi:hypothetical protein
VLRSADGKPGELPRGSALLIVDVQEGFDTISYLYASREVNREDSPCPLRLGYEDLSDPSETALRREVEA